MATKIRRDGKRRLLITIKNGRMSIDSQGFLGMECAEEALTRELKALGNVVDLKRKTTDGRPVHDLSVVDVSR